MPELPEVETIVRELREAALQHKIILRAKIFWPRSIATPAAEVFCSQIAKQKVVEVTRRGKFIVLQLSQDVLLVHLRMTGKLLLEEGTPPVTSHERVRLYLDDGRILRYEDQRKFGKWYLISGSEKHLSKLGIEPLTEAFTLPAFKKLISGSRTAVKSFLLNQRFVAGMGNIYVDEALWEAKIHPQSPVNQLSPREVAALHKSIPNVLQKGIDNTGTSLGSTRANYFSLSGRRGGNQYKLNVFRREGLPCPRCQTTLIKIVVAQRGTHLCPQCQKLI